MLSKLSLSKAIFMGLSLFISCVANAELTQVSVLISNGGNDCSGYFGTGTGCQITKDNEVFATIMSKFDVEDENDSEDFNGASLSDWTFDGNNSNVNATNSGSWTYSGSNYPGISFWVAKASSGFNLFWMVDSTAIDNNICAAGANDNNFSIACLEVAVAVTSGDWTAPEPHNLSHISFYGNKCEDTDPNCGDTPQAVPEPTTLMLFALGLLALIARRKQTH